MSSRHSSKTTNTTSERELPPSVNVNILGTTIDKQVGDNTHFMDTNWTSLRLISTDELQSLVQSYLLIHRQDGVDILCELSPLEVYSANQLHDWKHCRLSGKPPYFPTRQIGPIRLHVGMDADCFVDTYAKSFHIAREHSHHFQEHSRHLPSLPRIHDLCQAIVAHGSIDSKRANGQYRVNIGCGGQNWVNGAPCELHGMKFQREVEKEGKFDSALLLKSIGALTEFTWKVTCSLQHDANDHPIAPDSYRRGLYAAHLNAYLQMDQGVGFEDVTLVVSSLHPVIHEVAEHKDIMNDTIAGYTRTAAFNMVMIDNNKLSPTNVHFQGLCNFRKVIGHYVTRQFPKYTLQNADPAGQSLDNIPHTGNQSGTGTIQYIPHDAQLSYHALYFCNELRSSHSKKVRFKGRTTRTSDHQLSFTNGHKKMEKYCHPSMKMADFYMGSYVKGNNVKSMFVLGDAEHAVKISSCNNLEDYAHGKLLYKCLQSLPMSKNQSASSSMAAACYHMDSELNSNEVTFFPGHLDKPFVHTAWFVPLGASTFFTVLSVPQSGNHIQDPDSLCRFQEWKGKLSGTDSKKVDDFLKEFHLQAKKYTKVDSPVTLIYLNKRGSVLAFPANHCYHATITPTKPVGFPRDMLIFHPLDGLT